MVATFSGGKVDSLPTCHFFISNATPITRCDMLTQETLKSLLHYCPDTGVFTRIKARRGVHIGSIAGCVNNKDGYAQICVNYKTYLAHRLAWLYIHGTFPLKGIDHINRVRTDNRLCNLRLASTAENAQNQSRNSANTSGYIGVTWEVARNKWHSSITLNNKHIDLGRFTELSDAIAARKAGERKYHPFNPQLEA